MHWTDYSQVLWVCFSLRLQVERTSERKKYTHSDIQLWLITAANTILQSEITCKILLVITDMHWWNASAYYALTPLSHQSCMTSRGMTENCEKPSYRTKIQQVTQFLVCSESGNPLLRIHPGDLETWREHSPSGHITAGSFNSSDECHRTRLLPRGAFVMAAKIMTQPLWTKVGGGIASFRHYHVNLYQVVHMICSHIFNFVPHAALIKTRDKTDGALDEWHRVFKPGPAASLYCSFLVLVITVVKGRHLGLYSSGCQCFHMEYHPSIHG